MQHLAANYEWICVSEEKVKIKIEPNTESDDKSSILKKRLLNQNMSAKKFIPKKVKDEYLPPVCDFCMQLLMWLLIQNSRLCHVMVLSTHVFFVMLTKRFVGRPKRSHSMLKTYMTLVFTYATSVARTFGRGMICQLIWMTMWPRRRAIFNAKFVIAYSTTWGYSEYINGCTILRIRHGRVICAERDTGKFSFN